LQQSESVLPIRIPTLEINLLLALDRREQAALQAALLTRGAPDCLVTMALTGACKIASLKEAQQLRQWLAEAQSGGDTDAGTLQAIQNALEKFGI
jgi:hypothetical protein